VSFHGREVRNSHFKEQDSLPVIVINVASQRREAVSLQRDQHSFVSSFELWVSNVVNEILRQIKLHAKYGRFPLLDNGPEGAHVEGQHFLREKTLYARAFQEASCSINQNGKTI